MKKILLVLCLAVAVHAEFNNNSGFLTTRDNGADLQRAASSLARIETLLAEQNRLLKQLVDKMDPPKPVPAPKPVIVENPVSKPAPKYDKYNRDRMFIKPGEQTEYADEETESCIKECAEIYESTDKMVLKDCLMEMCGFSITDIYK